MSATNDTTRAILNYLFDQRVYAWRQNTQGLFDSKRGIFRPAAKKGVSDIIAILPGGKFCGIEIKSNRDKMSPEQIGFRQNVIRAGGVYLMVKDFPDFLTQWLDKKLSTL